jgi:hypothetical protein
LPVCQSTAGGRAGIALSVGGDFWATASLSVVVRQIRNGPAIVPDTRVLPSGVTANDTTDLPWAFHVISS